MGDSMRGKHLRKAGEGHFRKVHKIQTDRFGSRYKGAVVKIAKFGEGVSANKAEMQTWMTAKGTEIEKYFCPIHDITSDGTILIMARANVKKADHDTASQLRKDITNDIDDVEIPVPNQSFLDIHKKNVGYYNGNPVLIDYPYGANFEVNKFKS